MTQYNAICHVEIQVTDLDRSRAFYQAVFGWEFRNLFPGMDVFGQGGEHIGGLMASASVTPGLSPSIWFKAQNLDATLASALIAGGKAVEPRSEVPGVGWSATFADPDGTVIGIVEYSD